MAQKTYSIEVKLDPEAILKGMFFDGGYIPPECHHSTPKQDGKCARCWKQRVDQLEHTNKMLMRRIRMSETLAIVKAEQVDELNAKLGEKKTLTETLREKFSGPPDMIHADSTWKEVHDAYVRAKDRADHWSAKYHVASTDADKLRELLSDARAALAGKRSEIEGLNKELEQAKARAGTLGVSGGAYVVGEEEKIIGGAEAARQIEKISNYLRSAGRALNGKSYAEAMIDYCNELVMIHNQLAERTVSRDKLGALIDMIISLDYGFPLPDQNVLDAATGLISKLRAVLVDVAAHVCGVEKEKIRAQKTGYLFQMIMDRADVLRKECEYHHEDFRRMADDCLVALAGVVATPVEGFKKRPGDVKSAILELRRKFNERGLEIDRLEMALKAERDSRDKTIIDLNAAAKAISEELRLAREQRDHLNKRVFEQQTEIDNLKAEWPHKGHFVEFEVGEQKLAINPVPTPESIGALIHVMKDLAKRVEGIEMDNRRIG